MAKHITSELTGLLLDKAVALAEGLLPEPTDKTLWRKANGELVCIAEGLGWRPSSDWARGGPIIERERIMLDVGIDSGAHFWMACIYVEHGDFHADAETPLVAAMRAYVRARLGDEVELRAPEQI